MGKKLKLDFTGVESFQRASEGQHTAKIASVEPKTSQGGNDMLVVAFEVIKGDDKGSRVYENYPLIDTALWKLKGLLQAVGMKADGKVQLDLDKLTGKVVLIEVRHEEYDGKIRAKIDEVKKFVAASEADDDEDEEEPEDELEDEDEAEEEEEEEEEAPKKKPAAKKAPAKKPAKKSEPEEDDEDEDDDDWDDDEDEEEEEKPAKKTTKKAPAKKAAAKKAPEPEDDDDDDDDDWDDDEE